MVVNWKIYKLWIRFYFYVLWTTNTPRVRGVPVSDTGRCPTPTLIPMITLNYVIFSNYYPCWCWFRVRVCVCASFSMLRFISLLDLGFDLTMCGVTVRFWVNFIADQWIWQFDLTMSVSVSVLQLPWFWVNFIFVLSYLTALRKYIIRWVICIVYLFKINFVAVRMNAET